jgi:hypothetical protein
VQYSDSDAFERVDAFINDKPAETIVVHQNGARATNGHSTGNFTIDPDPAAQPHS